MKMSASGMRIARIHPGRSIPKAIPEFCVCSKPTRDPIMGMRDAREWSTRRVVAKDVRKEASVVMRVVKSNC